MNPLISISQIDRGLLFKLVLLLIFIIALANYTVQFPITTFGITWNYAMWVFPFAVLATDLTIRLTNGHQARGVVAVAFVPAILISIYLADYRIGVASGLAYAFSQFLDIFVFQKIRDRHQAWWSAPLISTFFANIIDTYLFYGVAFAHGADEFMAGNWQNIATLDLGVKTVLSIFIFLPIYGLLLSWLAKRNVFAKTS